MRTLRRILRLCVWRLSSAGTNASADGGFSLIELVVTSGVVATGLAVLAGVMTSGLAATGYARERQSASQLVNQTIETIRSLPADTMKAGLNSSDLAGDAGITTCGAAMCYGGERLTTHAPGTVTDKAPLYPHRSTATVGPNSYSIASYVTYYCAPSDATCATDPTKSDARRVTVNVSWASPLKGNATRTVQAQTITFAQSASTSCQTTQTHPFPGPCDAAFDATALQGASSINITGAIDGTGLDHATLWSGRATSDAAIEQTWHVQGLTQGSGAAIQAVGASEQAIGRSTAASKADNDPSTGALPLYDSQTLSAGGSSVVVPFGPYALTASASGTDSGRTTSTTSACTSGGCVNPPTPSPRNCPDLSGYANETDLFPCGGSSSTTASTVSAVADLGGLGTDTLATLGAQSNPTVATVDRKTSTGGTTCSSIPSTPPPNDGCIRGAVSRQPLSLTAGSLPSSMSLPGFTSPFVQITGLSDSVSAEAGIGTNAPSAAQTAGSITVWCAAAVSGNVLCPSGTTPGSYRTTTIASVTSTVTVPLLSVTSGATTVTFDASVAPQSVQTNSVGSPRTNASATVVPLKVNLTYRIVSGGQTIVDTLINLDPGTITATATYAPGLT